MLRAANFAGQASLAGTDAQTQAVILSTSPDGFSMGSMGIESWGHINVEADVLLHGQVALGGKFFKDVVNSFRTLVKDFSEEMEVSDSESELQIFTADGSHNVEIPTLVMDDFSGRPTWDGKLNKVSQDFCETLTVANKASADLTKPTLAGVYVHPEGFAATDSYQFILIDEPIDIEEGIIIPSDFINNLPDPSSYGMGQIQFGTKGDKIGFDFGGLWEEGYLIGSIIGDGCFGIEKTHPSAILDTWDTNDSSQSMRDTIDFCIDTVGYRNNRWSEMKGRNEYRKVSSQLGELCKTYGVIKNSKKVGIPIEKASSDFQRGLISALFDTDGHVEGISTEGGLSVRFSQNSLEMCEALQRMLARFGIYSVVKDLRASGKSLLPDGKGGKKFYDTKATYRLIIARRSELEKFQEIIGFRHDPKIEKLASRLVDHKKKTYQKSNISKIKSIVHLGKEDVYDVTIADIHRFSANGIEVSNCMEQPLADNEACTLTDLYLPRAESVEDFKRSAKIAFLYGKIVTLAEVQWEPFKEVMARNRRIGCSISGLAQFVESFEPSVDAYSIMTEYMDETYKHIKAKDKKWSDWLQVPESIRVTSVKPSGTTGLVAGVTPGVHWPVASDEYFRRIRFANHDPLLELMREAGFTVESALGDPDHTSVVTFPVLGPSMRSEREVSLEEKIRMAVLAQQWWSDNMVSATFSFSPTESSLIEKVIEKAKGKLKVMSFLPMGEEATYPQSPYERVDNYVFVKEAELSDPLNWQKIYNVAEDSVAETGCANDVCEINFG